MAQEPMSRREFIRAAIAGGVGLVVVATGATVLLARRSEGRTQGEITVPQARIPAVGAAPYSDDAGHFHLINNEDGALALYWSCTHQGCEVPWREEDAEFHCPCHDARYDRTGVVTGGPAPRPLALFPVRVIENGDIIVDTREPQGRDDYDPSQAVSLA